MRGYQREFIELALASGVLAFGEFTLKSGRISPYFFNAGRFASGAALARLGEFYARAIADAGFTFDVLFGPAYKGIPLAAVTASGLWREYGRDVGFAFNRKEAKDHGEGGTVIGAPLAGRVLVIDDVISAGTSVGESAALIDAAGARMAGIVVALDRQERGTAADSALREVQTRYQTPARAIIDLDTLVNYLEEAGGRRAELAAVRAYRERYGITPGT